MKTDKTLILTIAIVLQSVVTGASAGDMRGIQWAAASGGGQTLMSGAKQPGCVKQVAGTKWKGTKFYANGASSNFTIGFNAGGVGTEMGAAPAPIRWQQVATKVQWKKNIEDGRVNHTVQLKCNRMDGKFQIFDINGPLIGSGTVKMTLVN
jgi:hypothetical protein